MQIRTFLPKTASGVIQFAWFGVTPTTVSFTPWHPAGLLVVAERAFILLHLGTVSGTVERAGGGT